MLHDAFKKCKFEGGKTITEQLGGGKYVQVCTDEGGKKHRSKIRTRKNASSKWDANLA